MSIPHQAEPTDVHWVDTSAVQPLTPKHLADLPPDNLLGPLLPRHVRACDAWYDLVESRADAGLHPWDVQRHSERDFAAAIHNLVVTNVAYDANHLTHDVLPRDNVAAELRTYYGLYPPSGLKPDIERQRYQDAMIPRAVQFQQKFLEIGVVLGLRRAFIDRRLRYPSRATYGLLSAYGRLLLQYRPPATEEEEEELHSETNAA